VPKPIPEPVHKPKEEPIIIVNDDTPKPKLKPIPKTVGEIFNEPISKPRVNSAYTHKNQRNIYAHDSSTIAYRLIPRPDFSKK
jgi:hypothetical protein